ncbi:TAXI family TRAP transporter solute-binding subunit [Halalkalibacter krulwichiae]|uniref:NMT1/THI5 like protein n=1 Tax=Halalkalibacter krulwichiae TaxID=199441 RepID=A0A1X9MBF7_9BACI|nr:TAXI family TRAP transporter solute-binding subunit [Halalkalibacter krulwichiae]ARK29974.1 hypothetical protein BkAM31D_08925 [Halalkalibacter krulwichiae]
MKKGKLFASIVFAMIFTVLVAACSSETQNSNEGAESGDTKNVVLTTAGTSGAFYPIGAAMAQIVNNNEPSLRITNQASGGSVENVRLLKNGEVEFALLGGDSAVGAYEGIGLEFEGDPHDDVLKGVFSMYSQPLNLVTVEGTGIESFSDLEGKRIAVGAPGSGTEVKTREVLEILGLPYGDGVRQEYLSFAEGVEGMRDGHIDAAFIWAGIPTPGVMDLANVRDIKLIGLNDEEVEAVNNANPSLYKEVIPAGTYKGVDEDTQTLAVNTQTVVHADLDEEYVYNFVKAIFDNLDNLHEAVEAMREMTPETAHQNVIELHPGAKRYYQEIGVLD